MASLKFHTCAGSVRLSEHFCASVAQPTDFKSLPSSVAWPRIGVSAKQVKCAFIESGGRFFDDALNTDAARNLQGPWSKSFSWTYARGFGEDHQPKQRSVLAHGKQSNTEVSTQDEVSQSASGLPGTDAAAPHNGGLREGGDGNGASSETETGESESGVLNMVKGGVEAVKDAVVEEAAIVVEAVGGGMEVAAQTVASVGELPTESVAIEEVDHKKSLATVAFWITAAIAFGLGIGYTEGSSKASEFFAGYLLEQSLSVDNLLVFVLIFNYFKVPVSSQPRVLTYGIAGAVVFRGVMIALGVATLEAFSVINLVFAGILLFSSYKLLSGSGDDDDEDLSNNSVVLFCQRFIKVTNNYDKDKFYTMVDGVRQATPLLLTLAVVELSDVVFAVDSIPAVFGVTRDPFIVFSSNIFAILGLRSLYVLVSSNLADLEYLQPAVASVLGFVGCKMVVEFFGFNLPTEVSLGVVATVLGAGIYFSLAKDKQAEKGE